MHPFRAVASPAISVVLLALGLAATAHSDPWQITVDVDKPGAKINPGFYGLMTEEINHAFDGGLYAELVRNRSFKDDAQTPIHWSLVQNGGAAGTLSLDKSQPLNPAQNVSLKLEVTAGGGRAGVANDGFWGIPVRPDTAYQATIFARTAGAPGPVTVDLESDDGASILATGTIAEVGPEWKKYTVTLHTAGQVTPSAKNRLVISVAAPGIVWLGFVSLFPPTYKDRANGNRIDLMDKLADMQPSFLRLPGGNYVDPGHLEWKKTLGPVEERPGSPGAWNYRISEGLGLLELFEWCEDLKMEPLLAVTDGRPWLPATADVSALVQDALDEIEYATGGPETKWGARRVADGHPAPFPLHYVEIGNEDFFDKQETYDSRFAKFFDAIRAKYPHLQIIATRGDVESRVPDIVDDHLYARPAGMLRASKKYDTHTRQGPKVFVGEWATNGDGVPTSNLKSSLSDAAYLTGLERNADLVTMACYAPLLVNVNPGARQWPTNLIGYDALTSFGSPSYYMQVMFSRNKGDVVLPAALSGTGATPAAPEPVHGKIGVGTFDTQAEFKDISVTQGTTTLLQADFASGSAGWKPHHGKWQTENGALVQSAGGHDVWSLAGDSAWTDYTYKLKARKRGGKEGFLILFHTLDDQDFTWWNLGGWGNTRSALQQSVNGVRTDFGQPKDVTIENDRWYDIEIDVQGRQIRCLLDGKLVEEATQEPPPPLAPIYTSATRDDATGDVIMKVVNVDATPQPVRIELHGAEKIDPTATGQILTGQPNDVNSVAEPEKVAPQPLTITDAGTSFVHAFPANSVSVFRLKTR